MINFTYANLESSPPRISKFLRPSLQWQGNPLKSIADPRQSTELVLALTPYNGLKLSEGALLISYSFLFKLGIILFS